MMNPEADGRLDKLLQRNRNSTSTEVIRILFAILIAQLLGMLVYRSASMEGGVLISLQFLPLTLAFLALSLNVFHHLWNVIALVEDTPLGEILSVVFMVLYFGAVLLAFQYPRQWVVFLALLVFIIVLKNLQLYLQAERTGSLRRLFGKGALVAILYSIVCVFYWYFTRDFEFSEPFHRTTLDFLFSAVSVGVCLKNWWLYPLSKTMSLQREQSS